MREEELHMLFEAIEAMIEEKIVAAYSGDPLPERARANELKQEAINMIAYGEKRS